jgi:prevent-host-death family protein
MDVGVRDLRAHLSKHLQSVKAGAELTITDHGRAIARVIPIDERAIDRLVREGIVTTARAPSRRRPDRRISADETVSDLIDRQRG